MRFNERTNVLTQDTPSRAELSGQNISSGQRREEWMRKWRISLTPFRWWPGEVSCDSWRWIFQKKLEILNVDGIEKSGTNFHRDRYSSLFWNISRILSMSHDRPTNHFLAFTTAHHSITFSLRLVKSVFLNAIKFWNWQLQISSLRMCCISDFFSSLSHDEANLKPGRRKQRIKRIP